MKIPSMKQLRLYATGIVCFVLVGAFGGWLYVAKLAMPSDAHAQVSGDCKDGRNCRVATLTVTSASGAAGTSVLTVPRNQSIDLDATDTTGNFKIRSDGTFIRFSSSVAMDGFTTSFVGSGGVGITGPLVVISASTKGTKTLVAGSATQTVSSGVQCTCTDTTAANAVKCSVSGTTLTITGTGTDVIAYICL